MDGAGHNDTYINSNMPFPDPDAVQEFSLQSGNLSAQYGNSASGVVNIVTKSGTNALHGDVFEFLQGTARSTPGTTSHRLPIRSANEINSAEARAGPS